MPGLMFSWLVCIVCRRLVGLAATTQSSRSCASAEPSRWAMFARSVCLCLLAKRPTLTRPKFGVWKRREN